MAPILSQLAAAQSLQQQSVQQPVAQAAEPKPAPATMAYQQPQQQQVVASNQDQINAYANELKKAYELQIASLAPPASSVPAMGATVQPQQHLPPQKQQQQQQKQQQPIPFQIQAAASALSARSLSARTDVELNTSLQGQNDTNTFAKPRTDEDKAAGSILLGFLSSLRQSYLEAVREKSKMDCMNGASLSQTGEGNEDESPDQSRAPAVTDSSGSQPAVDSSLDDSDWNSDKKTDPSSSEDSDKEGTERPVKKRGQSSTTSASDIGVMRLSRGPPRKRLKTKKLPRKQARRLSR